MPAVCWCAGSIDLNDLSRLVDAAASLTSADDVTLQDILETLDVPTRWGSGATSRELVLVLLGHGWCVGLGHHIVVLYQVPEIKRPSPHLRGTLPCWVYAYQGYTPRLVCIGRADQVNLDTYGAWMSASNPAIPCGMMNCCCTSPSHCVFPQGQEGA